MNNFFKLEPWFKKPKVENSEPVSLSDEEKEQLIKSNKEFLISCEESRKYSNQRLDYLAIILSSTGLIFISNVLSYFKEQSIPITTELFTCAVSLFVITILINFFSQYISLRSFSEEIKITRMKIEDAEYFQIYDENKFRRIQKSLDFLDALVVWINNATVVTIFLGAISSVLFYLVGVWAV